MEISVAETVALPGTKGHREYSVIPLELLAAHIKVTLLRIEVEESVTEAPNAVLMETDAQTHRCVINNDCLQ